MKKIISTLLAASMIAAAAPIAAIAEDDDIVSYEQSFSVYPSDTTGSAEIGKWNLGSASGITAAGYLPLSSTAGNLYTAKYYIGNADIYYTDNTTVEFSADFKVTELTSGQKGFIGFNFMADGSTQTTLFLLGSNGSDETPHLYLPVSSGFNHDTVSTNGYDAGAAALDEWVTLTVKINNENISYYADGSYLATVDFTGKTPLGNSTVNNISIAARNTISGGARNFSYRVYNTGDRRAYLPACDFSGSFRMNTTAEISSGRLVFGSDDIITADRTAASNDMLVSDSIAEYTAAVNYNKRDHVITLNATVLSTAAEGDYFDIVSADSNSLTSARMRLVRLQSNGDGTYNILINTIESNDSGAAPTETVVENAECGTPVEIFVKIEKSTTAVDANVITYYIDKKDVGSVERTAGKVSYGRYVKLLANGASNAIASIDDIEIYCVPTGTAAAPAAPAEPMPETTITAGERAVYGAEDGGTASIAQQFTLNPNDDETAGYKWIFTKESGEKAEKALDTEITGNGEVSIGIILYNIPAADSDSIIIDLVSAE